MMKMKKIYWVLLPLALLLAACSTTEQLPSVLAKEAQSAELNLTRHDGSTFQLLVTDKALLDSLKNMIGQPVEQSAACGESGSIQFLKMNGQYEEAVLNGKLYLDANCRYFEWMKDGQSKKFALDPKYSAALDRMLLPEPPKAGPLAPLRGFLGLWHQIEGPGLISYEQWKEVDDRHFAGLSWTLFNAKDTIFSEKIELVAEGEDIFYIPTIKQNNGPVRFKMKSLVGDTVIFENPEHDFPQIIRYEMGDTLLNASVSGTKNGEFGEKFFPLKKLGN
jgi:hypothetical protein